MAAAPFFDWASFPAGVKFEPTDSQLLQHLTSKVQEEDAKAKEALGLSPRAFRGAIPQHPLIPQFVPTLNCEDGICGLHPEDLPGISREGITRHYFHRPSRAYSFGSRKRRKIQAATGVAALGADGITPVRRRKDYRWHKTGKTRPVLGLDKRQLGWKKILVLYETMSNQSQNASRPTVTYRKGKPEADAQAAASKGGEGGASRSSKDRKTNWIMHQYHLGATPEEREGEWVVAKVFYQVQQRQSSRPGGGAREDVPEAAVAGMVGGAEEGEEGEEEDEEEEEEDEEDAEGAGVVVEEDDIEEGSDGERDYQRGKGRSRGTRRVSSLGDSAAFERKITGTASCLAHQLISATSMRASLASLAPARGGLASGASLGALGAGPLLGSGPSLSGQAGLQGVHLGVQEPFQERTTPHRPIALRHGTRPNNALLRLSKAQVERPGIPGPLWSGMPQGTAGPSSSSSAPTSGMLANTTLGLHGSQDGGMTSAVVPGGTPQVQQGPTFVSLSARGIAPTQVANGQHTLQGPVSFGATQGGALAAAMGPPSGAPVVRPASTRPGLPLEDAASGASINSEAEAGMVGTRLVALGHAAGINLASTESLEESVPAGPDSATLPGDSPAEHHLSKSQSGPLPRGLSAPKPPVDPTEGQWVLVSSTEYSKGLGERLTPSVHHRATGCLGAPTMGSGTGTQRVGHAGGGQEYIGTMSRQVQYSTAGREGVEHNGGPAGGAPESSTTSSPEDPEFAEGMLLTPPEDSATPAAAAARAHEGLSVAAKQGTSLHTVTQASDAPAVGDMGDRTGTGAGAGLREKGFSQLLGEVMMGVSSPPPPGVTQLTLRQTGKMLGLGIRSCTTKDALRDGKERPQVVSSTALQDGEAKVPGGGGDVRASVGNRSRNSHRSSDKESPPQETDTEPQILTSQDFPSLGEDSAGMPKGPPGGSTRSSAGPSPVVGPSQAELGPQPGSQLEFFNLSQGHTQAGGNPGTGFGPAPNSLGLPGSQPLALASSQPLSLSQPGALTPLFSSQELRDLEAPPEDSAGMPDAGCFPRVGLGLGLGRMAHREPGSVVGTQESVELEPLRLSQSDAPVLSSQECRDLGTIFCSPPAQGGLGHPAGQHGLGQGQVHGLVHMAGGGRGRAGGRSPAALPSAHQSLRAAASGQQSGSGEGDGEGARLAAATVDPLAGGFFREEGPSHLEAPREDLQNAAAAEEAQNVGPGGGFLPQEGGEDAHPETVRVREVGPLLGEQGDEGKAGGKGDAKPNSNAGSGLDVLAAVMAGSSGKGSGKGRGKGGGMGVKGEDETSHSPARSPNKAKRGSPLRASRGAQRSTYRQSTPLSDQQDKGPPLVRLSPGKEAKMAAKAGGERGRAGEAGQQGMAEAGQRADTRQSPRKALRTHVAERGRTAQVAKSETVPAFCSLPAPLSRGKDTARGGGAEGERERGDKGGDVDAASRTGKKGGHAPAGLPTRRGRKSEDSPGRLTGQKGGREYWRNVVSMDE